MTNGTSRSPSPTKHISDSSINYCLYIRSNEAKRAEKIRSFILYINLVNILISVGVNDFFAVKNDLVFGRDVS